MNDGAKPYQQLGILLTGFGVLFYFVGLVVGFHRGLLLFANLAFFLGVFLIVSAEKFQRILLSRKRIPATSGIVLGFVLIAFNKGFIGSCVQLIFAFFLFGGFFPYILSQFQKLSPDLKVLAKKLYNQRYGEKLPR